MVQNRRTFAGAFFGDGEEMFVSRHRARLGFSSSHRRIHLHILSCKCLRRAVLGHVV